MDSQASTDGTKFLIPVTSRPMYSSLRDLLSEGFDLRCWWDTRLPPPTDEVGDTGYPYEATIQLPLQSLGDTRSDPHNIALVHVVAWTRVPPDTREGDRIYPAKFADPRFVVRSFAPETGPVETVTEGDEHAGYITLRYGLGTQVLEIIDPTTPSITEVGPQMERTLIPASVYCLLRARRPTSHANVRGRGNTSATAFSSTVQMWLG
jgi:hypothetical protein